MKKPLIIFGAGGLGREVKTLVDALPGYFVSGFCDDQVEPGTKIMGVMVLGDTAYLLKQQATQVVIAIGDPIAKFKIVKNLSKSDDIKFATLIHPRAILSDIENISVGEGSIITAGCILTTSIKIGKHVLVNLNCTVGHDVVIGDYSSIMPGVNVAGEVKIGSGVLAGSGANILNQMQVGDGAIIGSGAVVRTNINPGATAVGVPAREIK